MKAGLNLKRWDIQSRLCLLFSYNNFSVTEKTLLAMNSNNLFMYVFNVTVQLSFFDETCPRCKRIFLSDFFFFLNDFSPFSLLTSSLLYSIPVNSDFPETWYCSDSGLDTCKLGCFSYFQTIYSEWTTLTAFKLNETVSHWLCCDGGTVVKKGKPNQDLNSAAVALFLWTSFTKLTLQIGLHSCILRIAS